VSRAARLFGALLIAGAAAACDNTLDVVVPQWPLGGNLGGTTPLTAPQQQALEGVWVVEQGNADFGDTLVLKWNGNYLGIYGEKHYAYMVMQGGSTATEILIEGYWHYAGSEQLGLSQFATPLGGGGTVRLTGTFGHASDLPSEALVLRFLRPIAPAVLASPYYIISHHGSGGAPEILPYSENSVEITKVIERYGVNGIEVDVRTAKDGTPFLYHDFGLNWRLTQKGGLIGAAEDYTFPQLQAGVRLLHGEQIPSMAAFLDTVITATTLQFIYLDMKPSTVNGMAAILSVQQAAMAKAASLGRNVQIYVAITTDDVLAAYLAVPGYANSPTICELGIDILNQADSHVWSPRFTQQIPVSDINTLHSQGKLAITWTVNADDFVKQFVTQGNLDGILSDYPGIVAYYYYKQ